MALDAASRESNLKDSIKKYFRDNLMNVSKANRVPVAFFDPHMFQPKLQGQNVDRWVVILFGEISWESYLASADLLIYCATRRDNEGYKLSQLVDKVCGLLVDSNHVDNRARIDHYQSHPTNPWTKIGGIVVQGYYVDPEIPAEDETKYKMITARLRWGTK